MIGELQEAGATTAEYALTVTALAAIALTLLKLALSSFWQEWLTRLTAAVLIKASSFGDLPHVINYLRVW
jgi:Flp pilus assembly pilin Flp